MQPNDSRGSSGQNPGVPNLIRPRQIIPKFAEHIATSLHGYNHLTELNSTFPHPFFCCRQVRAKAGNRRDRAKMRQALANRASPKKRTTRYSVVEEKEGRKRGGGGVGGRGGLGDNEKTKERESWEDRGTKTSSVARYFCIIVTRARSYYRHTWRNILPFPLFGITLLSQPSFSLDSFSRPPLSSPSRCSHC